MIIRPSAVALGLAAAVATTGIAFAQPDVVPPDAPPVATPDGAPVPAPPAPPPEPAAPPERTPPAAPIAPQVTPPPGPTQSPHRGRRRRIPDLPQILNAPTGRLLPAAFLYSRSSVDTGGGLASDLRIGLGDVAEFGIATTELIRARRTGGGDPERIAPYVTASFRLGISEDRLFHDQPAIALGFRKSFERKALGASTRIAGLDLMLSKRLGDAIVIHAGAVFWDGSMVDDTGTYTFHDEARFKDQLRPLGGIEVQPLPDAEILIDVSWAPSFCYAACTGDRFRLDPILAWGVRYVIADWIHLESGVRVPDIRDVNLLDAQIFGQITFLSDRLRKVVDRLGGDD